MSDVQSMIYMAFIILFASSVQGAIGFGFVLISAPLLSLFLPLKILVPTSVIFSFIMNFLIVVSTKKHISLKNIWLLILSGFIGIPIGVYGLNKLNPSFLKLAIGIIIFVTSLAILKGFRIKTNNKLLSHSTIGFSSGILNGSISMSGPPIVLFLTNEGYDKDEFRANVNVYFFSTNILTLLTLGFSGLISIEVIKLASINVMVLVLGTFLGISLSKYLNENLFKKITLFMLMLSSTIAIINSLA